MDNDKILMAKEDIQLKNDVIIEHIPLVIHTISTTMGKYITTDSPEYSVGLLALNEAIDKYNPEKSAFSTFATMIIKNRVIDEIRREKKWDMAPIEDHENSAIEHMPDFDLKEEIEEISNELEKFGITFEDLAESSPSHYDTRKRCIDVSEKTSQDEKVMGVMYRKLKLPVKELMEKFLETKRFIYGNKEYITCLVIVFYKNFDNIKYWVQSTVRDDYNESL